jgi:ketosteroid isomerase-like protein
MTDSDAVLAANLEFYRAFTARDIAAMEMLWARQVPIACLHPGWTALKDRTTIMESWEGILSNPESPRIACFDEQVFLYGDVALVLCEEDITPDRSSAGTRRGDGHRGSIDGREPPD